MKKYFVLLFVFVFIFSFGQSVNNYKYALVPVKYSFLNENNQYQLNALTKFLMEKQGFITYLDTDELPEDFINSNCNKVYVDVISSGNFMGTKLIVVLKDCKNNVLFTSTEGRSKEKEYKKAYQEALREAFKSFNTLHYVYTPTVAVTSEVVVNEITQSSSDNLFAQPIVNGFQFIDSTPKVIMKIYTTSNKNCFIAIKGNTQGVLITKENHWFFEYYQNEKLISEKVKVKF